MGMYIPLQENVNEVAISASGWLVFAACLLITVGWLWYLYR
jgi:hypothetical protein